MAVLGVRRGATPLAAPPRWWRPPILDIYILREMAGPFAFGLGAFLLFWFINIFFVAADYLINKGAPPFLVLRFLLFRVPQSTPLAFPFACLFGTLLAFGRLTADNEIAALRTSGVPFWRIVRLPLVLGVLAFLAAYGINERLVPAATDLSTRTFYQIVYKSATLPIEPHLFRNDPVTGNTFYVDGVAPDGRTMTNVTIYQPARSGTDLTIMTAKSARIDGSILVLDRPVRTQVHADGKVSALSISAEDARFPLPLGDTGAQFLSSAYNDPYTMDSGRLKADIDFRKKTGQAGSDLSTREMTLASKLANPFSAFIAVVVALPLAVRFGRKGRTLGIALSIVVLFVYYVLQAMSAAFGRNGSLDPYLAAWIPNAVIAAAGIGLIAQEDR